MLPIRFPGRSRFSSVAPWVPVGLALLLSTGFAAAVRAGLLSQAPALLATLAVWLLAALLMLAMLHARNRDLDDDARILQTLAELESQHQLAEQLGGFGAWVLERQRDRFAWSPGAFRLFGIDPAAGEPTLRAFQASIHEDDRQRWREVHQRILQQGGDARIEFRFLRAGADTLWVRSVARAQLDPRGRIDRLAGVAHDITAIRAMQQQLAASEAKFRDLTQLSADWVWETDPQHRWSYFSESVDSVPGRWLRTLLGRRLWEPPEGRTAFDLPDWAGQQSRMQAQKPFQDFECALVAPTGKVHFLSLSGRPLFDAGGSFIGYRGIGADISREKRQRLLLRIEGEIASILRDETNAQVIPSVLSGMCGVLGWTGGLALEARSALSPFEICAHWGAPELAAMVAAWPTSPLPANSPETRAWREGRPIWVDDLPADPDFAERYQTARLGAHAALLAPILDERGAPFCLLVFLSPTCFRSDPFLFQAAEILARNLSLHLQRQAAATRLMHQSFHDALTDLPNRILLTRELEDRIQRQVPAAVLYIDLDRYKIINDTLGHAAGDQVLIEVARRLREAVRPQDIAGRIGGDEFIVLLDRLDDRSAIETIARALLRSIERPFMLMNQAHFLSASIGVAITPDDGHDAGQLIRSADAAMYRVKSEGRNDVRFSDGVASQVRADELRLASELPLALQRGEIDLYYQPILNVDTRRVVGYEALLRWRHPRRGLLTADQFVPIAEQARLIREVGQWALRRALDDRLALGIDEHPEIAVSVNVSPRQFSEDAFLETLGALLAERDLPPRLLRLELTESALIEHPERAASLIAELRRIGIQVHLGSFGTGYASLSLLRTLPVDGLKIDRSFVRGLPDDRGNAAIVQAITALAGRLGLQALAEGVETSTELRALQGLGCELIQGDLVSEPLPFSQLQTFLAAIPEVRRMHLVRAGPMAEQRGRTAPD